MNTKKINDCYIYGHDWYDTTINSMPYKRCNNCGQIKRVKVNER